MKIPLGRIFAYLGQWSGQMRITLSTMFTLVRVALTPVIVAAIVWHQWGSAFVLFVIAMITDLLDGYCARLRNEHTLLGACLDPIADKLLLISCFTALSLVSTSLLTIPVWFVSIVLIKELFVIVGATVLVVCGKYCAIKPTLLGKVTAAVQMLFIAWLFSCHFFYWVPLKTYGIMLSLLLFLVLASLLHYITIGIRAITNKSNA